MSIYKPKKLLFGTAGIPLSTEKRNTINGIATVKTLGLDAMELEFVRSVNISKKVAPDVAAVSKKHNVMLTCHAPYYINLNAQEKAKLKASKKRIIDSAIIADMCGAYSICFHPAYYMEQSSSTVYKTVKKQIKDIVSSIGRTKIWIRPETTGRNAQFGTLDELLELSQEIDRVMPCIDFAHLHARTGKFNTHKEFTHVLEKVEKSLGRHGLNNMHIHVSGIAYSEKGERNHLPLKKSDMNYKDLMKAFREFRIKGIVISESPNIESDALLMKKTYENK